MVKDIQTLKTAHIPVEQLDQLEDYARTSVSTDMRDVLLSLTRSVREGAEIAIIDGAPELTPNQAAERLGMSRTHLYKLLDRGEIVSHRIGRDRRISLADLVDFEAHRQRDNRERLRVFGQCAQHIRGGTQKRSRERAA